jgi:uncharacterized damage-inducible protein DinB
VYSHFLRLLAYNVWANNIVFEALKSQDGNPEMWGKFSHLLLAEKVWQSRLNGVAYTGQGIFDLVAEAEIFQLMQNNEWGWREIIQADSDFGKKISYKLLNGSEGNSTLSDILTHIFNHGTYHRAQIATLMRQHGLQPQATDFIAFTRI